MSRELKITPLSYNRIKELQYFCLQYHEKKEKLQDTYNTLKGQNLTGMPSGTDDTSTTERAALIAETISRDVKAIEQAAIAASSNYQRLLLYVSGKVKTPRDRITNAELKEFYRILHKVLTCTLSSGKIGTME